MKEINIRNMLEDEIEECAGVIRKGFGTVAGRFGLTPQNCPTNGAFMSSKRLRDDWKKGKEMYVAELDNHIIGFMQLAMKSDFQVELEKLTVIPSYRHYGYGKNMLDFSKKRAAERGANKLTIGIIEENTVLKEWYQLNGFQHDGIRKIEHLPFTVGFMSCNL